MKRKPTPARLVRRAEKFTVEVPYIVARIIRLSAAWYNNGDVDAYLRNALITECEMDMDGMASDFDTTTKLLKAEQDGGAL